MVGPLFNLVVPDSLLMTKSNDLDGTSGVATYLAFHKNSHPMVNTSIKKVGGLFIDVP